MSIGVYKTLEKKVIEAQKGNKEAFSEIYSLTYQKVYFYALQIMKNKADAEEIVQEVYEDVLKNINQLKNPMSFVAWLNKKTYFISMNYLRKHKRSVPRDHEDDLFLNMEDEHIDSQPEYTYLKSERASALMDGLDQLSHNHKSVILMRYYQNLTMEQIAVITGVSAGTVKSRLNAAKGYLKAHIEHTKSGFIFVSFGKTLKETLINVSNHTVLNPDKAIFISKELGLVYAGNQVASMTGIVVSGLIVKTVAVVTGLAIASTGAYMANELGAAQSLENKPKIVSVKILKEEGFSNTGKEIDVTIESTGDAEVYALSELGKRFDGGKTEENHYKIPVYKNGQYRVCVTSGGGTKNKTIEVKGIDNVVPEMTFSHIENETLVIGAKDDASGIDWSTSYLKTESGQQIEPLSVMEGNDQFTFPLIEEPSFLYLYDRAGNEIYYEIQIK